MKVKQRWYAGLAAAAVVAAAGYAFMLLRPRVITVSVYSDYAFRLQHSNWPDLLASRFRDAALIFQQSGTGVRWKVLDSNSTDPTSDMATLDGRRGVLPQQGDNKADVLVSFTGLHEADRIGSTNPFSRAAIVVDFPDRSESANTIILAANLAHMFAAPVDSAWVQSASAAAPQSVRFAPRVVTLIRQLRRYNFAAGVDGLLRGSWAQRAADAIAQADTTPNSNPTAHAQQVVGIALLNDRRREAAVAHLREASRLDPKSLTLHLETALALSRNGQDADALPELTEAVRLGPTNAILHQSLGALLVKMRRPEEATEEINIAASLDPKNATTQVVLATALSQQMGRFDATAAALQEALRLDPRSAIAAHDLEQLARNKQAVEDEIAKWRPRVQQAPDDSDAHYRLGAAIARSGDFQAGLRELQKSIELRPSYGPAHAESAAIYYQLGDYAAAWGEVKQSRALGSEPPAGLVAALTHKMPQPQ
ncbi:MAG: tetratricopeptide repeat protein [Bryobacteraceae bacterium]